MYIEYSRTRPDHIRKGLSGTSFTGYRIDGMRGCHLIAGRGVQQHVVRYEISTFQEIGRINSAARTHSRSPDDGRIDAYAVASTTLTPAVRIEASAIGLRRFLLKSSHGMNSGVTPSVRSGYKLPHLGSAG